jgi:hypothetical protein
VLPLSPFFFGLARFATRRHIWGRLQLAFERMIAFRFATYRFACHFAPRAQNRGRMLGAYCTISAPPVLEEFDLTQAFLGFLLSLVRPTEVFSFLLRYHRVPFLRFPDHDIPPRSII